MSLNPTHGDVYSIQHYVIKVISDLRQVCGFSGYSDFLYQWKWRPRYSWNIVESGIKHHDPNPQTSFSRVSNYSNHVRGNIKKKENHYTKKNNKVQILIRKTINANNMNSYKKLYIILMNISTMLKDIFRFFKGYSINNSITNLIKHVWLSKYR